MSRKLLKWAGVGVVLQATGVLQVFVLNLLLAKILGIESFGQYVMINSLLVLVGILPSAGVPTLLMKEVPIAIARENLDILEGLLRFSQRVSLLIVLSLSLTAMSVYWLFVGGIDQHFLQLSVSLFVILLFNSLISIYMGYVTGLGRPILGQFIGQVLTNGGFLILILVFSLNSVYPFSPDFVFVLHAFSSMFAFIIAFYCKIRVEAKHVASTSLIKPRFMVRKWLGTCIPLTLTNGLSALHQNGVVLIVGGIVGLEAAAQFRIAERVAALAYFIDRSLYALVAPRVSSLWEKEDITSIQHLLKVSCLFNVAFNMLLVIAFSLTGEMFIHYFFGANYGDSYLMTLVILIGLLVHATFGFNGLLLTMSSNASAVTISQLKIIPISLFLSILATNLFGAVGASVALGGFHAVLAFLLSKMALNLTGIKTTSFALEFKKV